MARQKSEFVSATGTTFEIVKGLAEEVWALGGDDDSLRRIIKDRSVRQSIAKLLVEQSGVGEIYEEEVDYDPFRGKPIDRSRYAFVGDVMEQDYPETETGKKLVRFREVWFDHDPTDDEVLAKGQSIGGRQPSRAESETVIRKRYTAEELGRNPRIGLIGPAVRRGGRLGRAYVGGGELGVDLYWRRADRGWDRRCRFVFVCE